MIQLWFILLLWVQLPLCIATGHHLVATLRVRHSTCLIYDYLLCRRHKVISQFHHSSICVLFWWLCICDVCTSELVLWLFVGKYVTTVGVDAIISLEIKLDWSIKICQILWSGIIFHSNKCLSHIILCWLGLQCQLMLVIHSSIYILKPCHPHLFMHFSIIYSSLINVCLHWLFSWARILIRLVLYLHLLWL